MHNAVVTAEKCKLLPLIKRFDLIQTTALIVILAALALGGAG